MDQYILGLCKKAKSASYVLGQLSKKKKNEILLKVADGLEKNKNEIFQENTKDVEKAKANNLDEALVDRLVINERRLKSMANGLRKMASLEDPIGEIVDGWVTEEGLNISKVRVPIGVIGMIYESRPNVTVDAMGLAFKTGNSIILRGGSEAIHSNRVLQKILSEYGTQAGLPEGSVQLIEKTDRKYVQELITMDEYLDVIIPRGGKGLKKKLSQDSTVPMIVTGAGLCHMFVDEDYPLEEAKALVLNAKVQRPGVCNAIETLLIHEKISKEFLPLINDQLLQHHVEVVGCEKCVEIIEDMPLASEEDFDTEYHRLKLSIKIVKDVDEAIEHINTHSTNHSESILTKNINHSELFLNKVDSAAVYINASTRFTDGGMFGFGGEIGISTQKLHARGPMGLKELTTTKYKIRGNGQIRQ